MFVLCDRKERGKPVEKEWERERERDMKKERERGEWAKERLEEREREMGLWRKNVWEREGKLQPTPSAEFGNPPPPCLRYSVLLTSQRTRMHLRGIGLGH